MSRFVTTLIFLSFFISTSDAQNYQHFTSWNRFAVQKVFNNHWEMTADVHLRRQNDFNSSNNSPLSLKLMEGFRISTTYRTKNFAFAFAPFLLHTYPLYAKKSDLDRPDRLEIRPSFFGEWTKQLSDKWTFRSRFGYEYRLFRRNDGSLGDEQGRVRLRLQMRYSWNEKNTVFISNEPLYNIPPNLPANSFSQNQLYFAYNHTFTPHFSFETGYMWNHRQRPTLTEFDEENILQTHFIFRL
jgi:Protein of unknown function (DUF2490)